MYKVEKYLDKCVESVINQTYSNIEIILVDDGSPDNCPAKCDSWAERDERIRVIHKQNGGLSSARNAGLDIARGELIGFVDSDDYILPEMYEALYALMTENDADISMCNFLYVDEKGEAIPSSVNTTDTFIDEVLTGEEALRKFLLVQWRYVVTWNKLYRAGIFQHVRFPEGRIHEEKFTAKKLYMYVRREDSIIGNVKNNFSIKRTNELIDMYIERHDFLRETGRLDLAEHTFLGGYGFILGVLGAMSYLKYHHDINKALLWVAKDSLKYDGLKMKLRPVKLFLVLLKNILCVRVNNPAT